MKNPSLKSAVPIFDKITIHLDDRFFEGETFVIETFNNSPENMYVQSARLNDILLDSPFFFFEDLVKGGKLKLNMGNKPIMD
jgi:putative alpha-1,2-mannosidase